jgi:hypothetical protein
VGWTIKYPRRGGRSPTPQNKNFMQKVQFEKIFMQAVRKGKNSSNIQKYIEKILAQLLQCEKILGRKISPVRISNGSRLKPDEKPK